MSIATEVMRVKCTGDGSTTSFAFPFKINSADDITVLIYDSIAKTITQVTNFVLTPNSAYPSLGGMITYPSSGTAADGTKIVIIERSMKILQNDTYQYGDTLNLDNIENSLDTMVMQQQQNADKADRSIKLPENVDISDMDLRIPPPHAGYGFCWDSTAKKFVYVDLSVISAGTGYGNMLKATYDTNDDGIVNESDVAAQLKTPRKINGRPFDGSADIIAVPVGHIQQQYVLEDGYLKLDGSTVSRATYAELWAWAQNNSLTSSSPSNYQFGTGDGSTTFVLPNHLNRVWQGGAAVGQKEAGLPNITGFLNIRYPALTSTTGVFQNGSGTSDSSVAISGANAISTCNFDASRSSSIYGNSVTVQPPAIALIPQIKY